MKRTTWLVSFAAAAVTACTQATPEQQIINDAAAALGGRDRILAVKTLVIEGTGANGNLGQDMTPAATSQAFNLTGYKRAVDVAAGRARVEQTRTPNFTYFQGQAPQKQVLGIAGDVGYNVAANGNATRVSNAVAKDRRAEIYHHPLTIVRAALDPTAKLTRPRTVDNQSVVDVTTASGLAFTLAIDGTTKLPARVVSMADNPNLGDVAIETSFTDYQDVSGLKLPAHLTTKTDTVTTTDIRATKQTVDGDAGDLAAPAAAASAAPVAGPPPATVTSEELAKGVWFLGGQSHHSVLVEFADHLELIEAPQNDALAMARFEAIRKTIPNKPVRYVINTHHHFDHAGGLRAAVAEGATIISHGLNQQFYEKVVQLPHTLNPDRLAKEPKKANIEYVGTVFGAGRDERELTDGKRKMEIYRVAGSQHADAMLIGYLPAEKILVEADLFTPQAAPVATAARPPEAGAGAGGGGLIVNPGPRNLYDNIQRLKLQVETIAPLHGSVVKMAELLKLLGV